MPRVMIIISLFFLISLCSAQEFTQIFEGDIVNDGGWNYSCCWADFDNDGWEDLFVCNNDANNGKLNFLYWNNGDGSFTKDETGNPVTTDGGSSYGCCAGDYDNDGWIDLFVANYNENNFLYKNYGGGAFILETTGSVVSNGGRSTGSYWIDYDKDGWLDLFVCNRDEVNFLYHNDGSGSFERVFAGALTSESRNTGNCVWADLDGNGYQDVYLANSGPDYNSLFLNMGEGIFEQVTDDDAVNDLENFDIVCCGDYDNDGDIDLYAAPGMLPASAYDVYLYNNDGDGSFSRVTGIAHIGINCGGGCAMIDYDNDGDLDIYQSAYDGNNLILENTGEGFMQVTEGVLANDGNYNKEPGWADYDQDGSLDIFIAVNNYFSGNNKLFHNNGNANNWLTIKTTGNESNQDGTGSVIIITAEINGSMVTQMQEVTCRNSMLTHFGFGDAEEIQSLSVIWQSGNITQLENVDVNQILQITEPVNNNTANILPAVYHLKNYPNPFNPVTMISFYIPIDGKAKLVISNIKGQMVRSLLCGNLPAGNNQQVWNGCDDSGKPVCSGIYFYSLILEGNAAATGKCILMK